MYKILIADDEFWVTALVRNSIDWTGMNPVSYTHLDVYKRQVERGHVHFGLGHVLFLLFMSSY